MVLDRRNPGAVLAEGEYFAIGQKVKGKKSSKYDGCRGTIMEIRDREDVESENKGPDIYVDFLNAEYTQSEKRKIAKSFSMVYANDVEFDEIPLNDVVCQGHEITADTSEQMGDPLNALNAITKEAEQTESTLNLLASWIGYLQTN